MRLLESLSLPGDLRALSQRELHALAAELRDEIVDTVSRNGGHLASNLGVIELTLALHSVFGTPADSIVWDVGHQCYAHKLLTGRLPVFATLRRKGGISGFPKPDESVHDAFGAGHASTSISAALGIAAARRISGDPSAVVAVIGDGSLGGGMAYEALCNAGHLGLPVVIVLNDNKMSISPNVGALSRYLSRLSATVGYQRFRHSVDRAIVRIPGVGRWLLKAIIRGKRTVKALFFKENIFSDLGLEYAGPIDGHNLVQLCDVLTQARDIRKPVVVHVVTRKGKGYFMAEEDPVGFHGVSPAQAGAKGVSFTEAFGSAVAEAAETDGRVVAITAAMVKGTGLSAFHERFPGRFFDVGIAEEHAVTFAAGLAAGGMRPVVAIYSTFMQRCADQVYHDVSLQNLPVVFALDRAGAVPDDGETHQGIYDVPLFLPVPGLSMLAPSSALELRASLRWALSQGGPVMIRYPKAACPPERPAYAEPLEPGRGAFARRGGSDALAVAYGSLVEEALAAPGLPDVYALRFLKPLDGEAFLAAVSGYRYIILIEEASVSGGIMERLSALARVRYPDVRAVTLGFAERPLPQQSREELLAAAGLSSARIGSTLASMREGEPA